MSYGANTYTYNADGIRTSKTVNGVEHIYHLSGTQILDEEWIDGNTRHLMVYVYDASGQPIGISHYTYNGTIVSENYYLLVSNIQGDIIGIYDSTGTRVVTYVYDAWGRMLSTTGTGANTIGVYNPFRYRGYYYDTETSLYYLNSRYYDPNVGRFLNADGQLNDGVLGYNLFAYCENNPVTRVDPTGTFFGEFWEALKQALEEARTLFLGCLATSQADGPVFGPADAAALLFATGTFLFCVGTAISVTIKERAEPIAVPKVKEKETQKVPKAPKYHYWTASIVNGQVQKGIPLTYSQAFAWAASENDLICENRAAAIAIVKFFPSAEYNPAHHNGENGYLNHYHLSSAHKNHIWFYGP